MRLAALLPFAVLASCSTSNVVESGPAPETVRVIGGSTGAIAMGVTATPASARSTSLSAAPGQVWRALPAAFQSLSIPVSQADSASLVVGNAGFSVRRRLGSVPLVRLIDCGSTQGGPSAETYDVRLTVTSQVRASDAGSSLATTVEAMGKPVAFSGEYIRCSSTGVLEARIADAVKAGLGK